jgi:hypothetical protein
MAMLANSLIVWCEVWKRKDNPKTSLGGAGNAVTVNAVSTQLRQGSGSEHDWRMCCEGSKGRRGLASGFREICG